MTQTEVSKQPTRVQQSQEHTNSNKKPPRESHVHMGGFRLFEQANFLHLQAKKTTKQNNENKVRNISGSFVAQKIYLKANREMQPIN